MLRQVSKFNAIVDRDLLWTDNTLYYSIDPDYSKLPPSRTLSLRRHVSVMLCHGRSMLIIARRRHVSVMLCHGRSMLIIARRRHVSVVLCHGRSMH